MWDRHSASLVCFLHVVLLCGCGDAFRDSSFPTGASKANSVLEGRLHGAQQPVVGSHVYIYAAGTNGNGGSGIAASVANASTSLLTSSVLVNNPLRSGVDSNGNYYVTTGTDGGFSVSGDFTCVPGTQVYLYAVGGNPGAGINTAAAFLAGLGQCSSAGGLTLPYVSVNEVSTVAAAYALAGFATDATHISSDSGVSGNTTASLAATGLASAMANVPNISNVATATALANTPNGNGVVPQQLINSVANILAACVNSTGPNSASCSTLFSNATNSGSPTGTKPTDTAGAAIFLAQNPGVNVATLYNLQSATPAFMPKLLSQPNDFSLGISFSFGGTLQVAAFNVAIDATGNIWIPTDNNAIVELSNQGAFVSGNSGFSLGSVNTRMYRDSVAIDLLGNAWVSNYGSDSVSKVSSTGVLLSPLSGFGGVRQPLGIAVDGSNNVWVASFGTSSVTKLSSDGSPLSGPSGYSGGGITHPVSVAIDSDGNVWTGNYPDVAILSPQGTTLYTSSSISNVSSLAIDHGGTAWAASGINPYYLSRVFRNSGAQVISSIASNALAVDGNGNVWITSGTSSLFEYSNSGNLITPSNGYLQNAPEGVAIDGSGNVWLGEEYGVTEVVGAGAPLVTPLAVGVSVNKVGARP